MRDDKSKIRSQDASRINVNEPYELDYWSKHLGVSKDALKAAVQKVGTSARAVEEELRRR